MNDHRRLKPRGQALIALLISLLAVALRVYQLDASSFWLDELYSAAFSNPALSLQQVYQRTLADVHPPLFHLTLHGWYLLTAYDDFHGRLLSALLGTTMVPVAYLAGKVMFSARTGLAAAAIVSTNYFLIHYSQEMRPYAMLALLSGLTLLFCYRVTEALRSSASLRPRTRADIGIYILLCCLIANTHYFGFLVLFAQFLYALAIQLVERPRSGRLLLTVAICASCVALSVLHLLPQLAAREGTAIWIEAPSPDFIQAYYLGYFYGSKSVAWLFAALAVFGILGGAYSGRHREVTLLALSICVPIVTAYIYSIVRSPVLSDRNTIVIVPALLLLAAYGLACIRFRPLFLVLLAFLIIKPIHSIVGNEFYAPRKDQWRDLLSRTVEGDDSLPVYAVAANTELYAYYYRDPGNAEGVQPIGVLRGQLRNGEAPAVFWVVEGHTRRGGSHWRESLARDHGLREVEVFKGQRVLGVRYLNATPHQPP